jgi:DDE_Tnp_1-associated
MEDFVEIRMWGELRLDFLRRFYPYERGLPSHDTLNDLLNALAPDVFPGLLFALGGKSA